MNRDRGFHKSWPCILPTVTRAVSEEPYIPSVKRSSGGIYSRYSTLHVPREALLFKEPAASRRWKSLPSEGKHPVRKRETSIEMKISPGVRIGECPEFVPPNETREEKTMERQGKCSAPPLSNPMYEKGVCS